MEGKITAVSISLSDGTSYSGDITEGALTGTANIKYSNGDQYSGSVVDGVRSGTGTYVWASGASYDGGWAEGLMSGSGTYTYSSTDNGYKLVGTFENGYPSGECKFYSTAYKYYKTDWSNGKCVKIYE